MHSTDIKVEIVSASQPQVESVAQESMSMKIDNGFHTTERYAVMSARIRALNSDID